MLQTISQITLCIMLLITTAWCIIVYRKLVTMKSDAGPINELVQALNQATKRADQTILAMRLVIKDADQRLAAMADLERGQRHVPKRAGLSEIDADRRLAVLEAATRQARSEASREESKPDRLEPSLPETQVNSNERVPASDNGFRPQLNRGFPGGTRRYEDSLPTHQMSAPARPEDKADETNLARLAQSIASLR